MFVVRNGKDLNSEWNLQIFRLNQHEKLQNLQFIIK